MNHYTRQDYKRAHEVINSERSKGELFNDFVGALNEARRKRVYSTPLMRKIIKGSYK